MTPQSKEMNQPPRRSRKPSLKTRTPSRSTIGHWNLIFTQVSKGGGYSKVDISKVNFEGKPLHKPRGPRALPHTKKVDEPIAYTRSHASPLVITFNPSVNYLYPTTLQLTRCNHSTTLRDQWRLSAPGHRPPSANVTYETLRPMSALHTPTATRRPRRSRRTTSAIAPRPRCALWSPGSARTASSPATRGLPRRSSRT
eukprot:scaffold33847_cov129-Isochrysis_galbana.AAC.2